MVETANYVHDLGGVFRVQVPGRLVGKQDRGIVHEGAGDSDALLLSAGKLVRIVLLAAMQSHHFEQFRGAPLTLARPGRVEQRQFDVLERGRAREQIETLEDEADAAAADCGEFLLSERRDVNAFERIMPAGRPIETSEDIHQGRLPRPRGAHYRDHLSPFDDQADAAQRPDLDLAEMENLVEVGDFEHVRGCHCGQRSLPTAETKVTMPTLPRY